jgi:two-component system C4-dicarboxylate transport sensor histidine kinase DctB
LNRVTVRALLGWSAALALIGAAALVAHGFALRSGLERLRDAAQHRLDMVAAQLDAQQARFDYLPSLLELTPSIFKLLEAPQDERLRHEVNRYLQGINATAGAANLYVLGSTGMGLAASDWDTPGTPVGADLSYRPYVQDALATGRGRFYGVGITSKRAGYFLSYALQAPGRPRGVAAVKVDLEEAERGWSKLPGVVLVADERDVVILSTHAAWKFRPLSPLTPRMLDEIATTSPYGTAELRPLAWTVQQRIGSEAQLISLSDVRYLASARLVNDGRWRLFVLDDTAPVRITANLIGSTAALAVALLWLLGVALWQRQRALRLKLASQAALQAAHDSLESKVEERTEELRGANVLLADEVEARKAIEADLRRTQGELVHAGKMAVLGQMSAGLVHELNQPLGALRTLSDNACVLLDQARVGDVRGNLERIAHLVDRLGRLTTQLKAFAYKAHVPCVPVAIRHALANAQFLVAQRQRALGVELEVHVEPPALSALAEDARLEQVLTNLLGNALDAMADSQLRRLRVDAQAVDGRCIVRVSDSGPGIREDILPRLFEPFTTTKPAGAGLGLGLMISAHIVRDFGGRLRASNLEQGGACFVIELPLAEATQRTAT